MQKTVPEYLKRGGTKSAIAKAKGWLKERENTVSRTYIQKIVEQNPDMIVEFDPLDPSDVLHLWVPAKKKVVEKKVFF